MHLYILTMATPPQLEFFEKKINALFYPLEGKHRTGYCIPSLTKIGPVYDIRIKKEVASQFLRDIDIILPSAEDKGSNVREHTKGLLFPLIRLFRFVTGLKTIPVSEKKYYTDCHRGWIYFFFLGALIDKEVEGTEVL